MAHAFCRTAETDGGDFREIDGFTVWSEKKIRGERRKSGNPTPEAQRKHNAVVAERKLARLIHANYTERDLSITLTYDDLHLVDDDEAMKRDARNYLARLRRLYGRYGIVLKYIMVCAHGKRGGRLHMHLIVNGGVPVEEIEELWGGGRARVERLKFDVNGVAGLANYIVKQAEVYKKRWCCSRNLIRPEPLIRDDRVCAKDAYALADRSTSPARLYELVSKLWPGYQLSSVQSQNLNEINGGSYFTLRLIRTSSKYAQPDYEHWSDAWLRRVAVSGAAVDDRDHIEVRDGRSLAGRRNIPSPGIEPLTERKRKRSRHAE